jgi:transketolase
MDLYQARVESFGCRAIVIDGHDIAQIDRALADARAERERPVVILARTKKGSGFSEVEDKEDWHGKALPPDMAERAIKELGGIRDLRLATNPPEPGEPKTPRGGGKVELPTYELGAKVATRKAYGDALRALGARPDVVVLDAEVSNSTYAEFFKKDHPERFFEMWIAEQQLVAAAVGMSVRGYVPFASTFAAFFTRAYDFIRMASISEANIRLSGSHAGVEIGADGPSQMALEDLAMMRAVRGSTVLYPSEANSAAKLVELMANTGGIVYMRTTRGAYPVLYPPGESFPAGGSKVVVGHRDDTVALIGAGVTVHLSLAAAAELAKEGIRARVIDLYSVKPVDVATLREASRVTGGRLVVVEDHHPEGGLGSAVLEALAQEERPPRVVQLAVRGLPTSGTPEELLHAAGIDTPTIVAAARKLAGKG